MEKHAAVTDERHHRPSQSSQSRKGRDNGTKDPRSAKSRSPPAEELLEGRAICSPSGGSAWVWGKQMTGHGNSSLGTSLVTQRWELSPRWLQ